MLRDFKFLRRNSGKHNEEMENVPVNPRDSLASQSSNDSSSRPPLNTIQEPMPSLNPAGKHEQDVAGRSRIDRTPTKPKPRGSDSILPMRTPDRHGVVGKRRFGWAQQKNEPNSLPRESGNEVISYPMQLSRGGLPNMTPRTTRTVGKAASSYSESNSTQSTPNKSVSKPPPSSGFRSKFDGSNGSGRTGGFAALCRGVPVSGGPSTTIVNTIEVPHFDLKEDPSFWMDHNVQVLIRVRPLNTVEKGMNGYNRCLKQESDQSITWIGQPETRFTFDHVACETVDQEMLFRMAGLPMVENCLSGYNSCMFAYGQTGSGKTYTMLGEIDGLEFNLSPHRGMTPRIFEFLFARIQAEEESRRDERLKYNCKCSFLEIYNEQIADLLDPSSTNLLLREDVKKGVYVENLSEFEVQSVSDIIKLLMQGSLNRKVAATNMNRESSRSHSVFTCVIESRWEKDSTTNLRFARLNLVDLAGSERQKSSGAEGDRLKEAANINKSLSTLGHVIMILVDVANGKPRHVPYRDSRLTFLLQDSLGGNSKTMIIANVSPSIGCATETLNTLKFAQRAKLIQNNAVVNEDSNGDVVALQHQIRLLKEELSVLKRQNVFRSLSFDSTVDDTKRLQDSACLGNTYEMDGKQINDSLEFESKGSVRLSTKQLKSMENTLAGSLRREQMAETDIKKLEAEIEHLNRLVRQREEDTRSTKMMLRFREDKIQRMESLLSGSLQPDAYLSDENKALCEEIQLLQAKVDKNPEVTRFALENIRLLDQLRRFQEFYQEGEREILLDELTKLREQLLQFLDGRPMQSKLSNLSSQPQLMNTLDELEDCKHKLNSCLQENQKLRRQTQNFHCLLDDLKSQHNDQDGNVKPMKASNNCKGVQNELDSAYATSPKRHAEETLELQLELDILKIILKEERSSRGEAEEMTLRLRKDLELAKEKILLVSKQYEDAALELKDARLVLEALESQQVSEISEMEDLKRSNSNYVKLLSEKDLQILGLREEISRQESRDFSSNDLKREGSTLETKLKRVQDSLEKAKKLNMWYQNDTAFKASSEEERDEVRQQVEAETAEVIVCMQEELSVLHQQIQECHLKETETEETMKKLEEQLCLVTEDNRSLDELLKEKEGELRKLSEEWESLSIEMEEILLNGQEAITDASEQLDLISGSIPSKRVWIAEQVGRLIRTIYEKEILIEELGNCLEEANNKRSDVESMLKSLRGAALAINEAHQQDCSEKETQILLLKSQLREKSSMICELEEELKLAKRHVSEASICATIAFIIFNRLSELNVSNLNNLKYKDIQLSESTETNLRKEELLYVQAADIKQAEEVIQSLRLDLADSKEMCSKLCQRLSEEEERVCFLKQKLEDIEDDDIWKTREKLAEFKNGVSSISSCFGITEEQNQNREISDSEKPCMPDDASNLWTDAGEKKMKTGVSEFSLETEKICRLSSFDLKDRKLRTCSNKDFDRNLTITLLKKEIESALQSLQKVKMEMDKLRNENEKLQMAEKQTAEDMKCLTVQLLDFQSATFSFQEQFACRIGAVNNKLQALELTVQDVGTLWCETKEILEMEVGDATIVANQKTAETSCILAKFEEAQYTMKEADIMINELVIANETMKLEMERLNAVATTSTREKDLLVSEIQSLQTINQVKEQQLQDLEYQFGVNLIDMKDLEGLFKEVQKTFTENFTSMVYELNCIKALFLDSGKLYRSWLEDVWSEIIVKDCAVSVLHLCHMGILLETVTGLNAENGLLQHGLCESNSLIANLREHNSKSSRELQICRTLKGKLLADIKNSFDRILRKEEETGHLTVKLNDFDKKIFDLQLQEELMLQRCNHMGSQLANLMMELDSNNTNVVKSLLDQANILKEKDELLNSQAEIFMTELYAKEIESFLLVSELQEMCYKEAAAEEECKNCAVILDNLMEEVIFSKVDEDLKEQILVSKEAEIASLGECIRNVEREKDDISMTLQKEIQVLKDVACTNENLKAKLSDITEINVRLTSRVQALESEHRNLLEDLKARKMALENSCGQISALDHHNETLQKDIFLMEISRNKLQSELHMKDLELSRLSDLEEENKSLKSDIRKLMSEKSQVLQNLEKASSEVESSLTCIDASNAENCRLQDRISSLEALIANLENGLEARNSEVCELLHSQSAIMGDLGKKSQELQTFGNRLDALKEENILLRNKLKFYEKDTHDVLTRSRLNSVKCVNSVENVHEANDRIFNVLQEGRYLVAEKMFHEVCDSLEMTSKFVKEIECLECHAKELLSNHTNLQAELLRKDDILKGLLFDLSLLQESASNSKDQKDRIDELEASLVALEEELVVKSGELDIAVAHSQLLEVQLHEKLDRIDAFESSFKKESESQTMLKCQNEELRAQVKEVLAAKCSLEEELAEKMSVAESLEIELSLLGDTLCEMNKTIDYLRSDLDNLTSEREQLDSEMHSLKQKLEDTQAWAEENEAIALEAQQIAESRRAYAEDKEEEVKLLERSVEELECTIYVLENKVDILKEETEQQRLQREELEEELQAVKQQLLNFENADTDVKRRVEEKDKLLEQVMQRIEMLERDISNKDAEIAQFNGHISELNLHAEAQAAEYKNKFKELEALVEQLKTEGTSQLSNPSSSKLEKNTSKSRGSSSPFKCIGLGMQQQIKSEKNEELTAARIRIEELESIAVNRQKEIFSLNARLAAAESMTHDVIRDLLGVKLDMTNFVSLLDKQQVQKIAEKAQLNSLEPHHKEQEVIKLKQQLNEFIEERQGWLEEIDCKQAEMVAAQVALEKLRQRDQLLKTENELLKMENTNHKKRVMELEGEVRKLSGQQNLQQRIHHHAKIKEENNLLKLQNEELSGKLHQAKVSLSRVQEELAHYRASSGKSPHINFDAEQSLMDQLKQIEQEKVQLAQKLVGLCTSILKAAGVTKPASNLTPDIAEETLDQLKNRITSLEREVQDLTLKNRLASEKIRLAELVPQAFPVNSRTEESCQTPQRGQVPFLSALDR
ncbi:hypothetical protein K2173_002255 [Erythroxylum novogranatense]|uniref:Kinesin motor domain-containing protein n=1 Tax=Erythroxylum novogranatense TaxID=1862640 RepID=A0AAV8T974_9ROSI|nr:hypothetical protein K2173_002255 [Erythroxylum novogranatense]